MSSHQPSQKAVKNFFLITPLIPPAPLFPAGEAAGQRGANPPEAPGRELLSTRNMAGFERRRQSRAIPRSGGITQPRTDQVQRFKAPNDSASRPHTFTGCWLDGELYVCALKLYHSFRLQPQDQNLVNITRMQTVHYIIDLKGNQTHNLCAIE